MNTTDYYARCCFSEEQLDALRQLYYKYFDPKMPETYAGYGVAAFWRDSSYPNAEDKAFDPNGGVQGFNAGDAMKDPLWNVFADLLPYMDESAIITKMTAWKNMAPHIDREWRPEAIYFPIDGCSSECVSTYYENGSKVGSFAVEGNAYLTNVHKMHAVMNKGTHTRIAFGWNFKSPSMTFSDCYNILSDLGYLEKQD